MESIDNSLHMHRNHIKFLGKSLAMVLKVKTVGSRGFFLETERAWREQHLSLDISEQQKLPTKKVFPRYFQSR